MSSISTIKPLVVKRDQTQLIIFQLNIGGENAHLPLEGFLLSDIEEYLDFVISKLHNDESQGSRLLLMRSHAINTKQMAAEIAALLASQSDNLDKPLEQFKVFVLSTGTMITFSTQATLRGQLEEEFTIAEVKSSGLRTVAFHSPPWGQVSYHHFKFALELNKNTEVLKSFDDGFYNKVSEALLNFTTYATAVYNQVLSGLYNSYKSEQIRRGISIGAFSDLTVPLPEYDLTTLVSDFMKAAHWLQSQRSSIPENESVTDEALMLDIKLNASVHANSLPEVHFFIDLSSASNYRKMSKDPREAPEMVSLYKTFTKYPQALAEDSAPAATPAVPQV